MAENTAENTVTDISIRFASNGVIIGYTGPNRSYTEEVFVKQSLFLRRLKELGEQHSPLAIPKD
jgi:hypothetical protein